jgi:glucose-6-phosphate isomerase
MELGACGAEKVSHYAQHIAQNGALSDAEQARLETYQAQLPEVRAQLLAAKADHSLPILSLPENEAETAKIVALAAKIRAQAEGLIVIGTGGSSLGAKIVCALSDDDFPVQFIENLDPHSLKIWLNKRLHERRWHLLIVSKSGGTMEVMCHSLLMLEALGEQAATRCHAISMPTDENPLRALAAHYGFSVIDHDPKVGGRFSVLSNVGLLPAALSGLDIAAIQRGASSVLKDMQAPLEGAAWQAALMPSRPISVLMPYCDRLELFGQWYRQLWAESLGKNGNGSTPIRALGSVDQHSQLQLYLDGPKDKSLSLITLKHQGRGASIPPAPMAGFEYLAGKSVGDVMQALQGGTMETLKRHKLPLRELALSDLAEDSLGALLMHFMIETMACATLIGVNAFDQPAVEESKQLARLALGAS